MRWVGAPLAAVVAVALAAGCTVQTEGAPCTDSSQCPGGQACGYNGRCSIRAANCPGCVPDCGRYGIPGTCVPDSDGACLHREDLAACSNHEVCRNASGGSTCSCPADCPAGGKACDASRIVNCEHDATSDCWFKGSSVVEDCASSGLSCDNTGTPACVCPPNTTSTFYADSTATRLVGIAPNGLQLPDLCRYATLADAILAAGNKGSGSTVKATGYATAPIVFTEGPLSVPAGIAVTTDENPPTTSHYVIEAGPSVTSGPFISLAAGAALSGFEVRNAGASGHAIRTTCPAAAGDTAPVTIDTVKVSGLGTGPTPPRFATGVLHDGYCPTTLSASSLADCVTNVHATPAAPGVPVSLTVTGSTLTGATDSAVVLGALGATSSIALTNNLITGNDATTQWAVGASQRRAGGLLFTAPLPAVTFKGNLVSGNKWDQIVVAASSGTLDLRGGATLADCSATPSPRNVIHCYDTANLGVGLYAGNATVQVDFNEWTNQPAVLTIDYVGTNVTGANNSCAVPPTVTCP